MKRWHKSYRRRFRRPAPLDRAMTYSYLGKRKGAVSRALSSSPPKRGALAGEGLERCARAVLPPRLGADDRLDAVARCSRADDGDADDACVVGLQQRERHA